MNDCAVIVDAEKAFAAARYQYAARLISIDDYRRAFEEYAAHLAPAGAADGERVRGSDAVGADRAENDRRTQSDPSAGSYRAFLEAKIKLAPVSGIEVDPSEVNPLLKPHQRAIVLWALRGGRRAIFAAFGLGKTIIQIEIVRLIAKHCGGFGLIVVPLGVRQEFMRDAAMLGVTFEFVRSPLGLDPAREHRLYLTNYETVRDGKLDPALFTVVSLDEAACLRGLGGTKTFREFMRLFHAVRYRFVATATPSPNEYIELLAYSAFLDVMDVGQAKTRFFKRDSENADNLTIHPHKEREFWLWVASWGLFVQRPSDLGFSDEGYELPELRVHWHELASDHRGAGEERDGQGRLLRNAAIGVSHASREKRDSLQMRVEKACTLVPMPHEDQCVIWCDLNDEQAALEKALKLCTVSSLYGNQDLEVRERLMEAWRAKRAQVFLSKPSMYGAGVNLQQCHTMIFAGIGFKFYELIQAIHRIYRFLQLHACDVHLIYTEAEREVRRSLEAKWARHNQQAAVMAEIIRAYGLTGVSLAASLQRSIGVARVEVKGERFTCINNDTVEETARLAADSVDLIITSIPFSTQYEYTPSYNDFGHSDSNAEFWRQMDYLTPELLRVLKPGRVAAIHVKDRIQPGGINGFGFQTVEPFSDQCVAHFIRHGWAFLARKTIVTDVVRENNQTYRLGWTEQCKDGTRMGCGLPEYLLLFRKAPTDRSNGYADQPVVKEKPLCDDHGQPAPFDQKTNWKQPVPGTGYSRARWQLDAHGFARSGGNRLLTPEELRDFPHAELFQAWRARSTGTVYDFAAHLQVTEELDHEQRLPATFMLLPPHSWHPDVWTDITRMRTLNGAQHAAGREMHLCPLQFDIVDRVITQFSMTNELVFDPFGGLMTVPYCALKLGRRGLGVELSERYFKDGVAYLRAAEREAAVPSLFDLLDAKTEAA